MTNQLSQLRWGRVAWTALTVYGVSFVIVILIVTAYATYLGVQVRGAPDQTLIQAFANQYAPWIGPGCLILFTFLGALWLARFVRTDLELHGLALGVIVSLVNLVFESMGTFSLTTLIATILIIGAGWMGGKFTTRA